MSSDAAVLAQPVCLVVQPEAVHHMGTTYHNNREKHEHHSTAQSSGTVSGVAGQSRSSDLRRPQEPTRSTKRGLRSQEATERRRQSRTFKRNVTRRHHRINKNWPQRPRNPKTKNWKLKLNSVLFHESHCSFVLSANEHDILCFISVILVTVSTSLVLHVCCIQMYFANFSCQGWSTTG